MKKAAIYLRVSTTDQNYDRQETELRSLANAFGYEIVMVFEEKRSAVLRMDTREQLTEMRKLKKSDVDRIFIWDITRLSRRSIDFINLIYEFADKKICLHFKDKNLITLDEDGKINALTGMYLYILGVFAQLDAESLKAKMKSGKENALLKGNSYTNIAPFGYELKNKHLYIKEDEAKFVRKAFDLYRDGKDLQYITDIFNVNKVPLKSNRQDIVWVKGTIYQMLKNPVYYGKGKYENIIKKADDDSPAEKLIRFFDAPSIISKEIYNEVQKKFNINKSKIDKGRLEPALLRGLLKCGFCNKDYVLGNNNKRRVYKDGDIRANVNNRVGCKNSSFIVAMADNLVWKAIKDIYEYDLFKKRCVEDKEKSKIKLAKNEENLEELKKSINTLEKENSKLNYAYLKGLFNEVEFVEQKTRIDSEIQRFNKIIDEILAENTLLNDKINANYDYSYFDSRELSLEEKKQVCKNIIDVIYTYRYTDYIKLLHIKLKIGLAFNILFDSHYKSNSYCIIDDDVVTFNNPFNAPEEVRSKIKDFSVTNSNNNLFNEEVFGEYNFNEIWDILKKYGYLIEMD